MSRDHITLRNQIRYTSALNVRQNASLWLVHWSGWSCNDHFRKTCSATEANFIGGFGHSSGPCSRCVGNTRNASISRILVRNCCYVLICVLTMSLFHGYNMFYYYWCDTLWSYNCLKYYLVRPDANSNCGNVKHFRCAKLLTVSISAYVRFSNEQSTYFNA